MLTLALACFLAAPLGWLAQRVAAKLATAPPPGPAAMIAAAGVMTMGALTLRPAFAPAGLLLGWGLLTLAAVDLGDLRLPNILTLPWIGMGLLLAALNLSQGTPPKFDRAALEAHGLGAAGGYLAFAGLAAAYRLLRGREGLGLGDAKLAAVAGAWLGWRILPAVVLVACGLSLLWIGIRFARQGRDALNAPLPFGPPLAAAVWLGWIAPTALGAA